MTPERWQQVKAVFHAAVEREPEQRAAFLDEACAGDLSLRQEVEVLLASADQPVSFIETPAVEVLRTLLPDGPAESVEGRRIGPYRILREIGHGGMGAVYLAERADDQFRKQVAIKLVKRGMDTDAILRRFRNEQQILADLDHPNIAKLLDGGTTEDGLSYFIMDYVEGLPIDVYCDSHKLDTLQRLKLFHTVCSAVQYAHQNHVIHRDLKPGNILVTSAGVPKLLDFGIAKLLDPERAAQALDTTGTPRLMTPDYASPEQVRGKAVTPASDVYALGVLLYELLTGQRPYRVPSDAPQELERVICEEAPQKPSTVVRRVECHGPAVAGLPNRLWLRLRRGLHKLGFGPPHNRLAGDLDNIVLMALRKEPERRYASAEQFAEDIRRHLDGRPVRACKDTLSYRSAKFLRRNKASAITAVLTAVILLALIGLGRFLPVPRNHAVEKPIRSLAVLPLANLSGDPQQDYFAEGMTEALITDLARIGTLRVISRTSVMTYKGTHKPLPEIGRKLNVEAVINGSVQRVGNRVQITVQLIHAATDRHLWTERYERDVRDVLLLQNEITQAIAQGIKVKLVPHEQEHLAAARPVNQEAFHAYLMGRYFWNKSTADGIKKGIAYFERAIEKDPGYALAYAGLADCYNWEGLRWAPPKEAFPKAKAAALRALEMDDTLAEAHTALAFVKHRFDWDWPGAEREFKRAIELAPGYAQAHQLYGLYLSWMGQREESIAELKRAQELDPLSLNINTGVGIVFSHARQYDQAIEQYRKVIDMDANYWFARSALAQAYVEKGMYQEAIAEDQKARQIEDHPRILVGLGEAYALAGHRAEAQKVLEELLELSRRQYVEPTLIASLYTALGEKDQAFDWLEKAYEARLPSLVILRVIPRFDRLRSDERFADLMRRIGLPP